MTTAHHGKAFHGGEHYENFPVGSWLVPSGMRPAILSLYRFARTGDDLADEGTAPAADRQAGLEALRDGLLRRQAQGIGLGLIGSQLRAHLDQHAVPHQWADDLLTAFLRDVHHQPFDSEAAVLNHCQYSAAPVGRLVLGLAGLMDHRMQPASIRQASDAICTGLQLANFAQDMGQDLGRGRCYLPRPWWPTGWSPALGAQTLSHADRLGLVDRMTRWALAQLQLGEGLPRVIRKSGCDGAWRLAAEIAVTVEAGKAICHRVLANPAGVWQRSPSLSKSGLVLVVLRAFRLL